jgi:hypothetical protein
VRSIVARPDFRLDLAGPASQSVRAGASAPYTLAVTGANGFVDLVSVSVTGLPAGTTALFTPEVIAGTGTSTLEVSTSSTTPTGSHLLTIVGRSGPRVHSMTVTLVVVGTVAVTLHLDRDAAGNRLLTDVPPTATVAKHADSPALSQSNGNPWRQIGTWQTAAGGTLGWQPDEVHDLKVWLGLRNSDDQGASFDLRTELAIDGTVIATGEVICVSGLTRNPARARAVTIALGPHAERALPEGALALTISTRIGTGACPGHASASGARLYYGSTGRDSSVSVKPDAIAAEAAPVLRRPAPRQTPFALTTLR